jgi:tetratricopeptide (TPR) repeat protein
MKKSHFLLALAVFFAALCVEAAPPAKSNGRSGETGAGNKGAGYYHFFLAKRNESMGRLQEAADEYKKVKEIDPGSIEPFLRLAEIDMKQNHLEEAEKEIEEALKIDPSDIEAAYLRVLIQESRNDLEGAAATIEKIIRQQPDSDRFLLQALQIFWLFRDDDTAQAFMEKIVAAAPGFGEGLWNLSRLYVRRGNLQAAIRTLEKLVELKRDDPTIRNELGRLYQKAGEPKTAGYHLEAIADMVPDAPDGLLQLVQSLVNIKEYSRAARVYQKIIALEPDNLEYRIQFLRCCLISGWDRIVVRESAPVLSLLDGLPPPSGRAEEGSRKEMRANVLKIRGLAFLGLDDTRSALAALEAARDLKRESKEDLPLALYTLDTLSKIDRKKAYEQFPKLSEKLQNGGPETRGYLPSLVGMLLDLDKKKEAQEMARRILKVPGDDAAVDREMATVFAKRNGFTVALEFLDNALSRFPGEEVEIQDLRAKILFESGDSEGCYSILERRIEKEPRSLSSYLSLAGYHTQKKDYTGALKVLQRAAAEFPNDASVEFHLGAAMERMGDLEKAEPHLRKAIDLNPRDAQALNYFGYTLADRGIRLEEAKDYVGRALAYDPENGAYLDSLGWVYFKMGRYDEAEEYLLKAIDRSADDGVLFEHLGDIYFQKGRWDEAIKTFEKALQVKGVADEKGVREKIQTAEGNRKGKRE